MDRGAHITLKARAIIRRGDDVLLSFAIDPASGVRYGRFLGGAVEFGERAEDTVRRELHEEIGFALGDISPLGVIEDVCEWDGRLHHEITFVFAASFAEPATYQRESFVVDETVCDGPAVWVPIRELTSGAIPLYPPELVHVLDRVARSNPGSGRPCNPV
jgi:ADP-ribose pyrophosphatase YjhB (NUDIX family)